MLNMKGAVPTFDRVYKRAQSKLATAQKLDHSEFVPVFRKNIRADELQRLIASAKALESLSLLSVAEHEVDLFMETGL
jgi:hypothetical protein